MTYQNERDEFIGILAREFPDAPFGALLESARLLMRHAATLQRLAVALCNGWIDQEQYEKRTKTPSERIITLCKELPGMGRPMLGGDPRGAVVKLRLPSKRTNSFGGDGWCVPTRN